jgi:diguanylate cyclase (GGDEF)-like protein
VLLCDLDGLKQINDTLGHEAGDAILKAVARALRQTLRETDIISRWGGDEFAILLTHTPLEGAGGTAERLRSAVLELGPRIDAPGLTPSLSIGVAPILNGQAPREAVAAADAALYKAKRGGRNQVVVNEQGVVADVA